MHVTPKSRGLDTTQNQNPKSNTPPELCVSDHTCVAPYAIGDHKDTQFGQNSWRVSSHTLVQPHLHYASAAWKSSLGHNLLFCKCKFPAPTGTVISVKQKGLQNPQ